MKFNYLLVFSFFLSVFSFIGCEEEPCEDFISCVNGNCLEGECVCDSLYEGRVCDVLETTKFVGAWTVGDICATSEVYDANIAEATTAGRIRFDQLGPDRLPVFATVEGNLLSIEDQAYGLAVIGGFGGIDTVNQVITLDYSVDYGQGNIVNCLTSLEK